jgi:hypothetical protein
VSFEILRSSHPQKCKIQFCSSELLLLQLPTGTSDISFGQKELQDRCSLQTKENIIKRSFGKKKQSKQIVTTNNVMLLIEIGV